MGPLGLFYFFLLSLFSLSIVPLSPALAAQSGPSAGGELTNTTPTHYSHRAFDDPAVPVNARNLQLIAPAAGDDTNIQQAAPPPEPIDQEGGENAQPDTSSETSPEGVQSDPQSESEGNSEDTNSQDD